MTTGAGGVLFRSESKGSGSTPMNALKQSFYGESEKSLEKSSYFPALEIRVR